MEIEPLEGKEVGEIDGAVEKVMGALKEAVRKHVPKIRSRTLLHPQIDPEIKSMMEEAIRIKMLLSLNIDYLRNRRRLTELREFIRERWRRKNVERWRNLVDKIDVGRNYQDFWKQVNRMLGRGNSERAVTFKDENGREMETNVEVVRAFKLGKVRLG